MLRVCVKPVGQKVEYGTGEEKVGGKLSQKPGLTSPEEPWAPSDQTMVASLCADEHRGQECGAVCRGLQTLSVPWRTDRANWTGQDCSGDGFSQGPSSSILPSAPHNHGAHWRPPLFSPACNFSRTIPLVGIPKQDSWRGFSPQH